MLIKLLGWLWIAAGLVFLLRPGILKKWLQKKSVKKLKKALFLITLLLSLLLIRAAWGSRGVLPKIVMAIGIIGIFKGFFILKAQAADRILKWYADRPATFYRFGSVLQIIIGLMILALGR